MDGKIQLRSIQEIPEPYSRIFGAYPSFNGVQSIVFDSVIDKDDSVVVTAPTGSGKTTIFELAIVKLMMNPDNGNFKIIYMAPVKALCSERFLDWEAKFAPLGLRCALVTGDTDVDGDVTDLSNLQQYDLVVTTPEKWDFLTRRWREHQQLMNSVRLFLIDEVHLINDQSRGHVLEAVVSRMKMLQNEQYGQNRLRFVAVSATVANTTDLAAWLGTTSEPAICYAFGEEMRPVKLNKVVKGYDLQATGFRFDLNLSYKVEAVLKEYSEGKPTLIFCSTRKSVLQTAQVLSQMVTFELSGEHQQSVNAACEQIVDGKLRDLLRCGIGYHHAGMPQSDRLAVENIFRAGHLPVLMATSTLAMGVNLPAHLVVLKNTQFYNQGGYEEYSENQILQMIGRAGRPQFDTSATAVIMTRGNCVARFQRLVSGCDPVRSWLQNQIVEHLNAEIVLGSVRNLDDAAEWLKSTFYWVCALKHPKLYGLPVNLTSEEVEIKLQEMIKKELSELESHGLVKLVDNFATKQTPFGRIMARYYISFDTMKLLLKMSGRESVVQLLDLLTRCSELRDTSLRMHEKKPLNNLNNDSMNGLRYPLPGKIVNKFMKINCLIQAVLGCRTLPEYSLIQDSLRIVRICQRISRCLFEVAAEKNFMSGQRSAAILAKCLRCQLWENSPMAARQLPRIGPALSGLLVAAGKTTLDSLATANPRDLERIMNRLPPMGDEVRNAAAAVARLQVHLGRTGSDTLEVRITRRILAHFAVGNDHQHWFVLIVGGSDDKLLFRKRFAASDVGFSIGEEETDVSNAALSFNIYLNEPLPTKVHAFLISESWVGVDSQTTLFLKEHPNEINADVEDSMYCDVPADLQPADEFYRPKEKTAPKRAPKPRATPAPKKTPAATKKTPATAKKPPVKSSSNDIRRFFPTEKRPKVATGPKAVEPTDSGNFYEGTADLTTEEEELPICWKSCRSIFEELRKDDLAEQNRNRSFSSSPAIKVFPKKCQTEESVGNATFSTGIEHNLYMDEEDDRIINCGFDAFMAEVEKKENEVEITDGSPEQKLLRPEPRCFGNDLTNMPSTNRNSNQGKQMSERHVQPHQPLNYPRPKIMPVEDGCVDYEEIWLTDSPSSNEVPESSYTESRHASDFVSAMGYKENSLTDRTKFDGVLKKSHNNEQFSDFTSTIGHGKNSLTDRTNSEAVPRCFYEEPRKIPHEESDDSFTSSISQRENLLANRTNFDEVPKYSYNNEQFSDFTSTIGHNKNPLTDEMNFEVIPRCFYKEPSKISHEGSSDFTSSISQRENLLANRTNFDVVPKYSYNNEQFSDSISTIGRNKNPLTNEMNFEVIPRCFYNEPSKISLEGSSDFTSTVSQRENLLTNRRNFDAAPKYSYSRAHMVLDQADSYSSTTGHRDNPLIDGASYDAVPKNSYNALYTESSESISTICHRESADRTSFDAVRKKSYNPMYTESSNFISTIGHRESADRSSFDAVPQKSYNTLNTESSDLISTIGHRESVDRKRFDAIPKTYKRNIIPVEDDSELVVRMGWNQTSQKLNAWSDKNFEEPKMSAHLGDQSEWRRTNKMRPKTDIDSSAEIYPIIDTIIANSGKRTLPSVKEEYNDFGFAEAYPSWEGDYQKKCVKTCSLVDFDVTTNNTPSMALESLRRLTPNVEKHFDPDQCLRSSTEEDSLDSSFFQSDCSAWTEDSGFWSANTESGKRNRRTKRKNIIGECVTPGSGVIAELGLENLLYSKLGSGCLSGTLNAFDVILQQETSAQQSPSQITSSTPASPWTQNQVKTSTPLSVPRTVTRSECTSAHGKSLPQLSQARWGTPRLYRLSDPAITRYKTDHVNASFENVVSSVKAEPYTETRYTSFDSSKSKKRLRLDGKPKAAVSIPDTHRTPFESEHEVLSEIHEPDLIVNPTTAVVTESFDGVPPKSNEFLSSQISSGEEIVSPLVPKISEPALSNNEKPELIPTTPEVPKVRLTSDRPPCSNEATPKSSEILPVSPFLTKTPRSAQNVKSLSSPSTPSKNSVHGVGNQQRPAFNVPTYKSVQNMIVTNINQFPQNYAFSSNGMRPLKKRFKPPPQKSQGNLIHDHEM